MAAFGTSVVICCHNSAARLPETLSHLAHQQVPKDLDWEVLVIDNASEDGTAEVAQDVWSRCHPAPLRMIREERLGTSYARERGLEEARYDLVSFLDDDNWASPEWLGMVTEVMTAAPDIGACGGANEAVCEGARPRWFERFAESYAVGTQARWAVT